MAKKEEIFNDPDFIDLNESDQSTIIQALFPEGDPRSNQETDLSAGDIIEPPGVEEPTEEPTFVSSLLESMKFNPAESYRETKKASEGAGQGIMQIGREVLPFGKLIPEEFAEQAGQAMDPILSRNAGLMGGALSLLQPFIGPASMLDRGIRSEGRRIFSEATGTPVKEGSEIDKSLRRYTLTGEESEDVSDYPVPNVGESVLANTIAGLGTDVANYPLTTLGTAFLGGRLAKRAGPKTSSTTATTATTEAGVAAVPDNVVTDMFRGANIGTKGGELVEFQGRQIPKAERAFREGMPRAAAEDMPVNSVFDATVATERALDRAVVQRTSMLDQNAVTATKEPIGNNIRSLKNNETLKTELERGEGPVRDRAIKRLNEIESEAAVFDENFSIGQLRQMYRENHADISRWYQAAPEARARMSSLDILLKKQEGIRNALADAAESQAKGGGEAFRQSGREIRSLIEMKRQLEKRIPASVRSQNWGLVESIGKTAGGGNIAAGVLRVLTGEQLGGIIQIGKGTAQAAISKFITEFRSPNSAIKRAFKNQRKNSPRNPEFAEPVETTFENTEQFQRAPVKPSAPPVFPDRSPSPVATQGIAITTPPTWVSDVLGKSTVKPVQMSSDLSAIRRVIEGKSKMNPAEMLENPEFSPWGKNVLQRLMENPAQANDLLNYMQNQLNKRVNPFKKELPSKFVEPEPVAKPVKSTPEIPQEQFMKTQGRLLSSMGIGFDPAFADFINSLKHDGAKVGGIVRQMMKEEITRTEAISQIKKAFKEYKDATDG